MVTNFDQYPKNDVVFLRRVSERAHRHGDAPGRGVPPGGADDERAEWGGGSPGLRHRQQQLHPAFGDNRGRDQRQTGMDQHETARIWTVGFGPFHLPGSHFGYLFLTHKWGASGRGVLFGWLRLKRIGAVVEMGFVPSKPGPSTFPKGHLWGLWSFGFLSTKGCKL